MGSRRGAAGQPSPEQPKGRGKQRGLPPVETLEREEAVSSQPLRTLTGRVLVAAQMPGSECLLQPHGW